MFEVAPEDTFDAPPTPLHRERIPASAGRGFRQVTQRQGGHVSGKRTEASLSRKPM